MGTVSSLALIFNIFFCPLDTFCHSVTSKNAVLEVKKFLEHIEHPEFDIQILHDDLSSNHFSFLQNSVLPMTTINLPMQLRNEITGLSHNLDVMRCRPGPNKISIWISKSLFRQQNIPDESMYFANWYRISFQYHYLSPCTECEYDERDRWHFITLLSNLYAIVPTILKMDDLLKNLNIFTFKFGNLLVMLVSERGVQLCVRIISVFYNNREDYNCKFIDDGRILLGYKKLVTPPKGFNVISMDSHRGVLGVERLPPPTLNPFNRDVFISIPHYIAVIVIGQTNATISLNRLEHKYPMIFVEDDNCLSPPPISFRIHAFHWLSIS
ncbi:hypothetical protein Fcan01_25821 [Folsomia candida]|uniref:Uncharacterized protein n=1 Tax=Folsomia candida TaxID=158441 RepID=A0A226D2H0_FOLCA|nr:hypothetical protein Fcan01_25821 [Folsomia candida]